MRIAVCCDHLKLSGGGRVAIELADAFNADVFVIEYAPTEVNKMRAGKLNVQGKISENALKYLSYVPTELLRSIWMRYKYFNLRQLCEYNVVITLGVADGFASRNNPNNIRYYQGFPMFRNPLLTKAWTFSEKWILKYVSRMVANSQYLANIVQKTFMRKLEVIYPPTDVGKFYHKGSEDYFLSVQQIVPAKRIDLQLRVFEKLPEGKLIIVGRTENPRTQLKYESWIKKLSNVFWIKGCSDIEQLAELYARCKAVIQTGFNESFGLVAVEAMASGKPCLAVNAGGFKETIIHGKTGLLIDPPYVENFQRVIRNFDSYEFDSSLCRKRAEEFSRQRFVEKMRELIVNLTR